MGCGTSFVKYVLFFFNLIFALVGLALLGVGVAVKLNLREVTDLLKGHFQGAPILCIIVGAVVFVIAFFGCCGAIRESHCMIVTYAILLLVIIIVQVVLAVLLFVYMPDVNTAVTQVMQTSFEEAQSNPNSPARESFSALEKNFGCCGTTGPFSYGTGVLSLPKSCCGGSSDVCTVVNASQRGCNEALTTFLNKAGKAVAGVAIGVAGVEIVGAIFALCLANSIRNMDRRSRY